MKHRIEQKPDFEVVGYTLRTTTVGAESMKAVPQFWDRCLAEGKVEALEKLGSGFGMLGLCAEFDAKMEGFTYVIGVELEPGMVAPAGAQKVKVPGATFAAFGCVGAMPDAIQSGWHQIMSTWIPQSSYVQASPVNFELYPAFPHGDERGDPKSPRCYTEIWIPIKAK